jgi:CubicO group peptidase (beta-lactamase class C family)
MASAQGNRQLTLHQRKDIEQEIPPIREVGSKSSIDSVISAYMQSNWDPGLAACIVKNDRIAWEGYYGLANIASQDPVKPGTIFMLASVSKTVVATALMQLWQGGRFKLDDSINAYLPFPVHNPNFPNSAITFRQLLCHVSSIHDDFGQIPYGFLGDPTIALGTFLREYLTPGGAFYATSHYNSNGPPQSEWDYSNVGAALCGYLVEVISGIPFDQYCRDNIFVPLGMTGTSWFLRDLDMGLIARPYSHTAGGSYYDYGLYSSAIFPSAQLRTTLRSLARFLLANVNLGSLNTVRILDSATVRLIRTAPYPSLDSTQGLLWYKRFVGQRPLWGHRGQTLGVETRMYLDEQRGTGVIVLSNYSEEISFGGPMLEALFAMADTLSVGVDDGIAGGRLPDNYRLGQNYPNPFNPSTTIRIELPKTSRVTLSVFDMLGREVTVLVNESRDAGVHEVRFDGAGVASGVYFYRLQAGDFVQSKKLVLLH